RGPGDLDGLEGGPTRPVPARQPCLVVGRLRGGRAARARTRSPSAMIDRLRRLETTRTAARLASLVGLVLVVAAFGMLVSRAVTLDFFNRQPIWVADAIP